MFADRRTAAMNRNSNQENNKKPVANTGRGNTATTVPVSEVPAGRTVRLVRIAGGRVLSSRLTSLGIVPGAEIVVMKNASSGPLIIAVQGSRIMLGRGEARKIIVRLALKAS